MNEILSAFLRRSRKDRRLTIRDVEERTGISNAYVSQVENGRIIKPSPSVLHKLSECYNISYERLMELAGHPLPSKSDGLEEMVPAFRLGDSFDDLTEKERKSVEEYIEFLRSRREKR